jgi:outer membrane protein OmpA-like peptidoglycan-associated protein
MSRKDENGNWSKPVNMGYPLNTYMDENSILISSNGNLGFFSSNRPGGYGSLDLYSFKLSDEFKPIPTTFVKGFVFDEDDHNPLEASFQLTDLNSAKIVSEIISNAVSGQFLLALPTNMEMAFHVEKEGYSFVSKNFSFSDLEETDDGYVLNIPMRKIKPGTFVLENIFFDVNKWSIKKSSFVELEKILKLLTINPSINVEISGHTDSDGDQRDNLILSTNRAKSVVDWLINRGVSLNRLSYVGYGEKQPILENSNETNKAKNRRTELTIK